MTPAKSLAIRACCLGAVAGSVAAVARAASLHGVLAIWGWIGYLDFLLPALAGALAGALGGALFGVVLGRRAREAAARPVGRFVAGSLLLEALLLAGFAWTIDRCDPTRLTERPSAAGPRPPDIVVIIYDAVRADIVEDGQGGIAAWAPRLKALAESGTHFRNAVAPAPWTVPSHASLFTGLSPLDHGAIEQSPFLAGEFETLAETLRERGYRTVGLVANPWLDEANGFGQGFEVYRDLWRMEDKSLLPLFFRLFGRLERWGWCDVGDPRGDKGARWMNAFARRVLTRLRDDEPLFLFINLVDGHPPYWAPPADRLRLVAPELLAAGVDPAKVPQQWAAIYTGKTALNDDQRKVLRGLNMGEVAYMDHHLGALLDDLEGAKRMTNALVAVTADHGSGLGEDRLLGSGFDLREEMLRIPMVVHFPGGRFAGTRRDDVVYLHDLHPTILALARNGAGASDDAPAEADSRNGRSLFATSPRTGGLAAYSRPVRMLQNLADAFPGFDSSALKRELLALRGPRYKLVWNSAGSKSLFDLSGKGEREDLAASRPELRDEQCSLLEAIAGGDLPEVLRRCLEAALARAESEAGMDPNELERTEALRHLGY